MEISHPSISSSAPAITQSKSTWYPSGNHSSRKDFNTSRIFSTILTQFTQVDRSCLQGFSRQETTLRAWSTLFWNSVLVNCLGSICQGRRSHRSTWMRSSSTSSSCLIRVRKWNFLKRSLIFSDFAIIYRKITKSTIATWSKYSVVDSRRWAETSNSIGCSWTVAPMLMK